MLTKDRNKAVNMLRLWKHKRRNIYSIYIFKTKLLLQKWINKALEKNENINNFYGYLILVLIHVFQRELRSSKKKNFFSSLINFLMIFGIEVLFSLHFCLDRWVSSCSPWGGHALEVPSDAGKHQTVSVHCSRSRERFRCQLAAREAGSRPAGIWAR